MSAPFKIKDTVPVMWRMREDDPYEQLQIGAPNKSRGVGMIIGVVAAAAAVVTGGATLAAWATASTAQLISAGAMVAGGVMSGVGAVTGNQKLMKIGGVLSLTGGIGSALSGTAFSKGLLSGVDASGAGASAGATEATAATAGLDTAKTVGGEAAKTSTEATLNLGTTFEKAGIAPLAETPTTAGSTSVGYNLGATTDGAASASDVGIINKQVNLGNSAATAPNPTTATNLPLSESLGDKVAGAAKGVGGFVKDNKEVVELSGKILQGAMSKGPDGAEGNAELQVAKARQYDASARSADASASANLATANATNAQTSDKARAAANANAQVVVLNPKDPSYAQKKAAAEAAGYRTVDMVGPASGGPVTMGGVNYGQTTNQWASAPNGNINIPRSQR